MLGLKRCSVQKNLDQTIFWVQNNIGSKHILRSKKLPDKQNFGPKQLSPEKIGSKTLYGQMSLGQMLSGQISQWQVASIKELTF